MELVDPARLAGADAQGAGNDTGWSAREEGSKEVTGADYVVEKGV